MNEGMLVFICAITGHDEDTVKQLFNDWLKSPSNKASQLEPLVMPNEVVAGGSCLWSKEDEDNNSYYETGCGNAFECMNGDYQHNHFTHCPFCGKPIEEDDSQREA